MESTDGGSFSELGMATADSEWWGAKWGAILHQHPGHIEPAQAFDLLA